MPTPHDDTPATPAPEDKARVEALVAECIEAMERGDTDPADRICSDRPDLLTRVRRRLAQLAKHGLIPTTEPVPRAIGPYRIVRELGSGGMGTVWLAEQSTPVRREVALKVVKLGMDTREVVARFEAERQALARMNHPHIAQVFDAGITTEGRPFFVMEFVGGESMTTFADRRALTTERRVQLLATVCRAVQHAHERGFIHRDLKPSNVLVAEHGDEFTPKIIDFGIAKATSAAVAADTDGGAMTTRIDQVLGTPEYMSPEQACSGGLDVDTRSDVWSLGVILYELLCGELPFDSKRLRRATRREMEQILTDELPTLPSRRLSQVGDGVFVARRTDRSSLQRRVAGELDWITLKALQKERLHRYPSALSLAEDLERWLRKEPVAAAPPGRTYRLRKFVQRNRTAVAAATAVLLSLVAGLVLALRAQRAEARALADTQAFYGLARDAFGGVVDVADEGLVDVPQAEPVRRRLLEDALGFYERLRELRPEAPELRVDLVSARYRIGMLQQRLGQTEQADTTLRQCEHDLSALPPEAAAEPAVLMLAIKVPQALAHTASAAGRADARTHLARALDRVDRARAVEGDVAPLATIEARLLVSLANETTDDLTKAFDLYARAMAAFDRAGPGDPRQQRDRARCSCLYAEALTRQNRVVEAADLLARAAAQLQAAPAAEDATQRELEARVQHQFARVLRRLDRFAEARTAQQRAIDLRARLAAEHPDLTVHADEEAAGLHFLAQIAVDSGDPRAAIEPIDRAIAIRERLAARSNDAADVATLARSLLTKCDVLVELWQHHGGDVASVQRTLDRARAVVDPLSQTAPDNAGVALTFAAVHGAIASIADAEGDTTAARKEHETVRARLAELLVRRPKDPDVLGQLAYVESQLTLSHWRAREWDAAIAVGMDGLEHARAALRLDAKHRQANAVIAQLVARTSAAQLAHGDGEGGIATIRQLVEDPLFDTDAREWGALLLGQHAIADDHGLPRTPLLERAAQELRAAIDRRGPFTADTTRPGERDGASHTASRLRDFDLRSTLAEVHARLDDPDSRAAVLDEALQLAATMPNLSIDRRRNVFAQAAEVALQRDQPKVAEARLEELLQAVGPDGHANAMVAAMLVKCIEGTTDEAEQKRLGNRAVQCLATALEKGELSRAQAGSGTFAALRGRADYEALLDQ